MITSLLRALRTTIVGADPATPVKAPRSWLSALGIVILVGLGATTMQYLMNDRSMPPIMAAFLAVLTVLPVFVMYRSPLWAWRITFIGLLLGGADHKINQLPWNPVQIFAALIVLVVVALREPNRITALVGLLTLGLIGFQMQPEHVPGTAVLITVLMVLGQQIQRRRRVERDLEMQSEQGQLATARTRIARELHDVVAHSMSLVAVRAETAPYRLPDLPESARAEFAALADTAREALVEMRRLLGVLRTEGDTPELAPQPQLSDVEDLITSARQAGMKVSAGISTKGVDDALGLTAYRIVQEALSNAARHAPGVPVEVNVKEESGQMVIAVRNGPGPEVFRSVPGHGMTGMRERAELLGGTFEAGPLPGGGFAVTARIPLQDGVK